VFGLAAIDSPLARSFLAPIAAVLNLQAARPLARNDDLGMTIAEFDLSNRPASSVDLPEDSSCTPTTAATAIAIASRRGFSAGCHQLLKALRLQMQADSMV
jgi:hypothetical protein